MTNRFQNINLTVTPLVAYGLVFLLLIFLWLGVEHLTQVKKNFGDQAESLRTQLATIENINSQDKWSDRLDYSLSYKEQVNSSIWRAGTAGVIAAELQQFLQKVTEDNGFKNVNINVDPNATKIDELSILAFDLTGRVETAAGGISLLGRLAQNEQQIILNEVNIINDTRDRRPTRIVLSGTIPIQLTNLTGQEDDE